MFSAHLNSFNPAGGVPREKLAPRTSDVPAGKTSSAQRGCDGHR